MPYDTPNRFDLLDLTDQAKKKIHLSLEMLVRIKLFMPRGEGFAQVQFFLVCCYSTRVCVCVCVHVIEVCSEALTRLSLLRSQRDCLLWVVLLQALCAGGD